MLVISFGIFLSSAYTYWAYFTVLQKFSVNITSVSVMAVPILAILIDYIIIDIEFSIFDGANIVDGSFKKEIVTFLEDNNDEYLFFEGDVITWETIKPAN